MKAPLALLALLTLASCAPTGNPEPRPAPLAADPLPHHRRWPDGVGQGGQPAGDLGYAALAAEGYTTVLSVDGALPDVAAAKRHGLRVVHVPIGYDGITSEQALRIVRAAQVSPGPTYVHCHHGRHRGPAAAMLVRRALHGLDGPSASSDLRLSGCSERYQGLYQAVESFQAPSDEALAAINPDALANAVPPSTVVEYMLDLDATLERLIASRNADWGTPPAHPDVVPAHQALLLREGLREFGRVELVIARTDALERMRAKSEASAGELEALLQRDAPRAELDDALRAVRASCTACHDVFRNG